MALCKWNFFFTDGIGNGFGSALYRDDGNTDLDVNANQGKQLLGVWMPILGEGVQATYIRQSFDGTRGDGLLTQLPDSAMYKGAVGKPMEQAGSCMQINCSNAARTRKKAMFIHGVWDTKITGGRLATPSGFLTKENDFFATLKIGWGWKGITTKTPVQIIALAPVGNNQIELTVDADLFFPPFDGTTRQVQINGLESIPPIRNPVVVRPKSARVCVTRRKYVVPLFAGGQMTTKAYGLFPFINCDEVRACIHKVGRPFRPQAGGHSRR